jgi:hypothetical protein
MYRILYGDFKVYECPVFRTLYFANCEISIWSAAAIAAAFLRRNSFRRLRPGKSLDSEPFNGARYTACRKEKR